MLLKKGCERMFPTTPSLLVGSLSNSCQEGDFHQDSQREDQHTSICGGSDPFQQVLGLLVDPAGVMGRVHTDGLKELVFIVAMERRLANQHLVQQDSKGPPVHGEGVLLTQQDLGPKTSLRSEPQPQHSQLLKVKT